MALKKTTKKKTAKKKLTAYEKNCIKWDKEAAWKDAIILAYDFPIRYDYCIPENYRINKAVRVAIDKLKLHKKFKDKVWELVHSRRDEYSELESYMSDYEHRFGSEWFHGYGTLYRWRPGEKEKAEARVEMYLSDGEKKCFEKIREAIKITKKIEPFESDKEMGIAGVY
jgi:hypothetical protein